MLEQERAGGIRRLRRRFGSAARTNCPQDGRLNFFLKTQVPETFPPTEKIEVATADESFRVLLSFKDGNLTLQDSKTVFAVLDPMKLLGPSAFGPSEVSSRKRAMALMATGSRW